MTHGAHRLAAHRLGGEPVRRLLTGGLARYRIYETADGRFLTVAALEPKFAARLAELLELPSIDDADAVAARIRWKPLAHWLELFEEEDVAVGPVATLEEAAAEFGDTATAGRAPTLGEHTDAWRRELGVLPG
jgi:crotonobetainyl-CoA:carnitine CoA-transferase CaiB-like acyl-CoA transferase